MFFSEGMCDDILCIGRDRDIRDGRWLHLLMVNLHPKRSRFFFFFRPKNPSFDVF